MFDLVTVAVRKIATELERKTVPTTEANGESTGIVKCASLLPRCTG